MRIALIADTHLSSRSPECVANWHAARRAVERLAPDLTIHLGDITLDGQSRSDELGFAAQLMSQWPSECRCVPGNHDLGDGSGEVPLEPRLLRAYETAFGPDRWAISAGGWKLLGINAQLLGSDSAQERSQWDWLEGQAEGLGADVRSALFLHRPAWRPSSIEFARRGRYVERQACERLLDGALRPSLRLVVSGHLHQYLDITFAGVRHLWMPSTAFVLPDAMQARIGEKLVGIGMLDLGDGPARFDLWCPDGISRHDVSMLRFFHDLTEPVPAADSS